MTENDEEMFLSFLRECAPIRLYRIFAPSADLLQISKFPPRGSGEWAFLIANDEFPWQLSIGQVSEKAANLDHRGWFYIANAGNAPVIEYLRYNFTDPRACGRIYWAKTFSAPNGLDYDFDAFDSWYQKVARWLRKHGQKRPNELHPTFYLPDAWNLYGSKA